MGNHSVTYTDSRGRQLDIEVDEDASAWVGLRLSENREPLGIVIPADKRETLARALAGWHHGVQPAQPDRPEPVDPSEVRVGDVVEIEADDGSWMVRGRVGSVGNQWIRIDYSDKHWTWIHPGTVRILHRAEPEPDPAAVEALAALLDQVDTDIGLHNIIRAHDYARELIRRGVVIADA